MEKAADTHGMRDVASSGFCILLVVGIAWTTKVARHDYVGLSVDVRGLVVGITT